MQSTLNWVRELMGGYPKRSPSANKTLRAFNGNLKANLWLALLRCFQLLKKNKKIWGAFLLLSVYLTVHAPSECENVGLALVLLDLVHRLVMVSFNTNIQRNCKKLTVSCRFKCDLRQTLCDGSTPWVLPTYVTFSFTVIMTWIPSPF